MFLLIILSFIGVYFSGLIASLFSLNLISSIIIGGLVFLCFFFFSLVFIVLLSMRLGRNNQTHLVKSSIDAIVYFDDTSFKTLDREFSWDEIQCIDYTEESNDAYLITNRYNIGGLHRLLLLKPDEDRIEYIAVLPIASTKY